jgi:hypothetical protein
LDTTPTHHPNPPTFLTPAFLFPHPAHFHNGFRQEGQRDAFEAALLATAGLPGLFAAAATPRRLVAAATEAALRCSRVERLLAELRALAPRHTLRRRPAGTASGGPEIAAVIADQGPGGRRFEVAVGVAWHYPAGQLRPAAVRALCGAAPDPDAVADVFARHPAGLGRLTRVLDELASGAAGGLVAADW